ncbi:MAG: DUF3800 domain-containing protein [bacterium]
MIDKKAHVERYGVAAFHPYHYSLSAMLERYCRFLKFYNAKGDVLVESRGGKEDHQIKMAYRTVYHSGTQFRAPDFFQKTLTSNEIKIKPKSSNIAGLQLSDLLAYPCKQEILLEQRRISKPEGMFGKEICRRIGGKYIHEVRSGRVYEYGKIFLK